MKLKPSPFYHYVAIEARIYALCQEEYDEFKKLLEYKNKWDEALEYVEKRGDFQFELDGNYRY